MQHNKSTGGTLFIKRPWKRSLKSLSAARRLLSGLSKAFGGCAHMTVTAAPGEGIARDFKRITVFYLEQSRYCCRHYCIADVTWSLTCRAGGGCKEKRTCCWFACVSGINSSFPGQTLTSSIALLQDIPALPQALWKSFQWVPSLGSLCHIAKNPCKTSILTLHQHLNNSNLIALLT